MRLVVPLIAGLWLFVVGLQGLSFLTQYGLVPLPPAFGRVDFTPQYTVLMALVIVGAVLARVGGRGCSSEQKSGKQAAK